MEIKSVRRFVRNTPDKIRIFSSMLQKKNIEDAIAQLENNNKYASEPLILVLKQAKDMIKAKDLKMDDFTISEVRVDEGPKLKRRRICSKGRSTMILKRMAHITIILSDVSKSKIKIQKSKLSETNKATGRSV